jgi:hypothetical protein
LYKEKLSDFAEVHCGDSLIFLQDTNLMFDFAFFDSECEIRVEEFKICRERGILKGAAVFHDTSPTRTLTLKDFPKEDLHAEYRRNIYGCSNNIHATGYFESKLSRGVIAIFLQ